LHNLDIISPNETEVLRIEPNVDVDNPVEEIRTKIIAKYKNLKVLLKLGSKGSSLITDKLYIHCDVATKINPAILTKYKIIDTVGAGDCFTSAFCVKLLESDWSD
jgi:sugar/nucleoside kinase (ribokinase family)